MSPYQSIIDFVHKAWGLAIQYPYPVGQLPAKLSPRPFVLASCEIMGPADTCRFLLGHYVLRSGETFGIVQCNDNWKPASSKWYGSMSVALLFARELYGIPLAAWNLFEPPRSARLFSEKDSRWVRRRHSQARKSFLNLRHIVRPTKGYLRAMDAAVGRRTEK